MSLAIDMQNASFIDKGDWTLKKKWPHVIFWLCYYFFWVVVTGKFEGVSILDLNNLLIQAIFLIYSIVPVYTILYLLMPMFLYKQRILTFIILFILVIFGSALFLGLTFYGFMTFKNVPYGDIFDFPAILGPTLGSVCTSVFICMVAKSVKNYTAAQNKNKQLEFEKTENELKFLKSQLNPHFLFNALNNIYFLIKKDPDTAADNLAKFSDMVRYQLYECNEEKIKLSQEIEYIDNYIKISALGKAETTDIKVDIEDVNESLKIPPLVLVPLVENAFKHAGENIERANYIYINISMQESLLICTAENSKPSPQHVSSESLEKKSGGLGLQNLKRRLSLLYPENHKLDIKEDEAHYSATLKLTL